MSRSGWRPHIEGLRRLSLSQMMKSGAIKPDCRSSGTWVWSNSETGEKVASIGYTADLESESGELRLNYSVHSTNHNASKAMTYAVRLCSMPLHYGGRRWYFLCPASGKRATMLYLVQGIFAARRAIRPQPTYESQRLSGIDWLMAKRWAIRRKLGDPGCLLDPLLVKPKGMRWKTWARHCQLDTLLSEAENNLISKRWERLLL